jgi:hypothetical protein
VSLSSWHAGCKERWRGGEAVDARDQRIAELEDALARCQSDYDTLFTQSAERLAMLDKVISYQREHYGLLERAYNALVAHVAAHPPAPPSP